MSEKHGFCLCQGCSSLSANRDAVWERKAPYGILKFQTRSGKNVKKTLRK